MFRHIGWLVQLLFELIWLEFISRIYKDHGWGGALAAIVAPLMLLAASIGMLFMVIHGL